MTRIDDTFARLKAEGKKAFVAYIMGGDPDEATSLAVMQGLPAAGVDVIELGHALHRSDGRRPDDPACRPARAGRRHDDGQGPGTWSATFRAGDQTTPIVLMGYYNPIYSRGVDRFLAEAIEAGIDGLIVVDLPPEEDAELCIPAQKAGLNFIRLATPTTDAKRLPKVLQNTSGFVYYVSITGITGAAAAAGHRRRARGRADQAVDRPAGHRGLRHQHPRSRRAPSPAWRMAAWSDRPSSRTSAPACRWPRCWRAWPPSPPAPIRPEIATRAQIS